MRSKHLILPIVIALLPMGLWAQSMNWNINRSKPLIFYSANSVTDPGVTPDQMKKVSVQKLMDFEPATVSHGIELSLNDSSGEVKLSVYLYDDTTESGQGPLIYRCVAKTASPTAGEYVHTSYDYDYGEWLAWWPADNKGSPFEIVDSWHSADMKPSMFAALRNNYKNYFTTDANALPPYSILPIMSRDLKLNVIIELQIYKADVKSINVPGIGKILPGDFRPSFLDIRTPKGAVVANNAVSLDMDIYKPAPEGYTVSFSDITIVARLLDSPQIAYFPQTISSTAIINNPTVPYHKSLANFITNLSGIPKGPYAIYAEYTLTITSDNSSIIYPAQQFLTGFRNFGPNDQIVYDVKIDNYNGLPVYLLSGGMSAEYGVEKSLASLNAGISHTWAVRNVNGQPDMADGGPVSVYATPHFLDKSVKKTVDLYNASLGVTYPFETVIIGTGVAHVPYLAGAMKAPFLPMHFLVSSNSAEEVKTILDTANLKDGYSSYATLGYDPSITDIGVAWIKLRTLPALYRQFLIDHQVKNVIIMGYFGDDIDGEGHARRIIIDGQPDKDYAAGSMYMMWHGSERTYRELFKDFYKCNFKEEQYIPDWEGGLSNIQVDSFSAAISTIPSPPKVYTIQTRNSLTFYQWATPLVLSLMKKVNKTPAQVVLNEYLIGYPEYELWRGWVPYLYWQGVNSNLVAFRVSDFGGFKMKSIFPSVNYSSLPVFVQAKANRSNFVTSLRQYFNNVGMNAWQKADVWNPADGMAAPCEKAAVDIVTSVGGASAFRSWVVASEKFTIEDLDTMAANSVKPPPPDYTSHPVPNTTTMLKTIADAGLAITQYKFNPNSFWQPKNFPNIIEWRQLRPAPVTFMGYLDGQESPNDKRQQVVTIAQFDLSNSSDEYDLRIGYKFNLTAGDGFRSYNPALGEQQKMDCFEYTSIPLNRWLDIPSRVMARAGAVMIFNGSVYDFDYNGIPGVVPFIKRNDVVLAQPQILSYKGEGAFAWKWGSSKTAAIMPRPKDVPATNIANYLSTMFHTETAPYPNVLGGLTYMTDRKPYDYTALQPQWMRDYPAFPYYYLIDHQRCYYAPLSQKCGGTEVVAPVEEGWNNCALLAQDSYIQRFSTLAYRQYPRIFDDVPNARTFVGIKGNKLDIGIVAGDLGQPGLRGYLPTKKYGMLNYELGLFYQYKGYDRLVNLDGGSSTQFWLAGRGPLQLNGYPLENDNQGPYYSRLVSSFLMLVPKLHTDQIKPYQPANSGYIRLDNSAINFAYDDQTDLNKDKAFICLSPKQDSLNTSFGQQGMIAGNFKVENAARGGVLFYLGEDAYYPDTKGLSKVIARIRNLVVMGVGNVLPSLADSLSKINNVYDPSRLAEFLNAVKSTSVAFYYIKLYDGQVVEYIIEESANPAKYINNTWHSFQLLSDFSTDGSAVYNLYIDDSPIGPASGAFQFTPNLSSSFLNVGFSTHAMIGAMNLDGRFLTGDAKLVVDNFMYVVGAPAIQSFSTNDLLDIRTQLTINRTLPAGLGPKYYAKNVYALQFEETAGQHVFSMDNQQRNRLYGLMVNAARPGTPLGSSKAAVVVTKDSATVLPDAGKGHLTIQPNPAADFIVVSTGDVRKTFNLITVYAANGNVIVAIPLQNVRQYNIDVHRFAQGVYLLKAQMADGTSEIGKFVKQ